MQPKEALKRLLALCHILLKEVSITKVIESHLILRLCLRSKTYKVVVVLYGATVVSELVLYLTRPEETQCKILRSYARIVLWCILRICRVVFTGIVEVHLCTLVVTLLKRLQAFEIDSLTQRRLQRTIAICHRNLTNCHTHLIVIARIVVCCNQQLTCFIRTLRVGISHHIASQDIYRLIKDRSICFEKQLSVVKQCIFQDIFVELTLLILRLVGSHRKCVNSLLLVATTDIAVSQVVRSILRQLVSTLYHLEQSVNSLCIVGRAISRITKNVVFLAAHLSARALIHRHIVQRLVVASYAIPRLGNNSHQLGTLNLHRLHQQLIAILHHILVVSTSKLNLEEVVRYNLRVVVAITQRLKTLVGLLEISARIVYVRLIVDCVISIASGRRKLREECISLVVCLVVLVRYELDITHSHIVALLVFCRKSLIRYSFEIFASRSILLALAVIHRQHKANLIDVYRLRITTQEGKQYLLRLVIAQFVRTHRQLVIDMANQHLVVNRYLLA